jgi:hypothetical protein
LYILMFTFYFYVLPTAFTYNRLSQRAMRSVGL